MPLSGRSRAFAALALAATCSASGICLGRAAPPASQVNLSDRVQEVVATLATGQVTIIRAKDGLIVASVGNSFEPDSLPPRIVPLGEGSVGVVLGADDWIVPPPAGHTLLRLDRQLPSLIQTMGPTAPSLRPSARISHLEQLSMAVLEPLRAAASNLHSQIHLPPNLPLTEILLVRQSEAEPLLVWDLSYWIHQTFWQENFWATEVERPRSTQLYPTKGDKTGIVQVSYPPGDRSPSLADWLTRPTGRFAQTIEGESTLAAIQKQIADRKLKKVPVAELARLVKTALETMTPTGTVRELATVDLKTGFAWIIRPPISKAPAKLQPGAPSLENPPSLR